MLEKLKRQFRQPGKFDYLLFFIAGALGPMFPMITASMSWGALLAPVYILTMLYNGALLVIALRKQLWDDSLTQTIDAIIKDKEKKT
jgi:hypothetical protein